MPIWEQWISAENNKHHKPKINKNIFCKKNRIYKKQYGKHVYKNGSAYCSLCGHKNKAETSTMITEIAEDQKD